MNNGNVSGHYVELQRSILGQLPRDYDWVELDYLTHHSAELAMALEEAIRSLVPTQFDFMVPVHYGISVDEVLQEAEVFGTCPSISDEHLKPRVRSNVRKETKFVLKRFPGELSGCVEKWEDFLSKREGWQSADLWEMVALAKLPIPKHSHLVALGSSITLSLGGGLRYPHMSQSIYGYMQIGITARGYADTNGEMFFVGVQSEG